MNARKYVAVLIGAVLVGCGAPAADETDETDERFIAVLEDKGVPIERQDAFTLADAVCLMYQEHPNTDLGFAVLAVIQQRPGWSDEQAGAFIGAAVVAYCPEYRNF